MSSPEQLAVVLPLVQDSPMQLMIIRDTAVGSAQVLGFYVIQIPYIIQNLDTLPADAFP